jgi:hypothetical protein
MKKKARHAKATGPAFKVPEVKADRGLVVKESKVDMKETLDGGPSAALDNLAELAEALRAAKAKKRRRP